MYSVTTAQVIDLLEAGSLEPRPGQPIQTTPDECPALYEVQNMAPFCPADTDPADYGDSDNQD